MDDATTNIPVLTPGKRLCPTCGRNTDGAHCPRDRTPTIQVARFAKHPKSFAIGEVIADRYRITGTLGAGGFASVFAAEHIGTHQPVAVKLMAAEVGAAGAVAVRRFFREARVTASLQHPKTVRIYDVGQDAQGPLFMAMELLPGRTLQAELRERITNHQLFTEAETIAMMVQVLDSLAEAHAYRLVHRDLKPANLMLNRDEDGAVQVKVLDFGIARVDDSSLTATGSAPGTPAFMSPEQCMGGTVDGRSDLYAVAVLMFACVAGRLPFENRDPLRLLRMHVQDTPPDPQTLAQHPLTDGFVQVILRSLAKSPAERFPNAVSMRAALLAVAAGEAIPADLPDPPLLLAAVRDDADEPEAPAVEPAAALPMVAEPVVVAEVIVAEPAAAAPIAAEPVAAPPVPAEAAPAATSGAVEAPAPSAPARTSGLRWPIVAVVVTALTAIGLAFSAARSARSDPTAPQSVAQAAPLARDTPSAAVAAPAPAAGATPSQPLAGPQNAPAPLPAAASATAPSALPAELEPSQPGATAHRPAGSEAPRPRRSKSGIGPALME